MTTPTARPTPRLEPASALTSDPTAQPPPALPPPLEAGDTPHGRAGRLRARLSERDLGVLESLAQLKLLTGKQIQRLHIADGSPLTQARRTRAVLQRLTELRVVVRLTRRIGGIHAGSEGTVYGLTGLGLAVLGIDGPYGGRRRTVWTTKPAFQDHVLAIGELCVRLTELSRENVAELLAFDAEPTCWRRFPGSGGQSITLKPDAYVCLGIGEFERRAFIEMDLNSESLPTIVRKLGVYVDYWRSGQEQHRHGIYPRVWWLVPDTARLKAIARTIQRVPADARDLFTVALIDEAPHLLTQLPQAAETEA